MSSTLNDQWSLDKENLRQLAVYADCIRFVNLVSTNTPNRQTAEWILSSDERLHGFVETVLPTDDIDRCFEILTTLAEHDPDCRDRWFDLMLALSVVWDVPHRPPLHNQEGKTPIPYETVITERYDYFKDLYSGSSAKMPYSSLTAAELVFVVETPVPLSELKWARNNETGSCVSWGRKFYSIRYDRERLETDDYDWPWGIYKLSGIKERGGICVDQAYYAVMTARAFGIPSIYFHAKGKSGGHAWFSHMLQPGQWELNIGRYESQEYTTGLTINPQTNKKMTDHDIAYTCERSLHSESFWAANAYASIAEVLLESDTLNARRCAKESYELIPLYLRPWKIETEALIVEKDYGNLLALIDEQRHVFSEYPDLVIAAVDRVEPVLIAAGRAEEASRLRRSLLRGVDGERDDLRRVLGRKEIDVLVKNGDIRLARQQMERLMNEHIVDGAKALPLITYYLAITKDTSEAGSAARFLTKYTDQFEKKNGSDFKYTLLKYLLSAYKNSGDEKDAQMTQLQMDCY